VKQPLDTGSKAQRARLRWLIREYGLGLVSSAVGVSPATLARYLVGEQLAPKSMSAIDTAFRQLGSSVGLEPEPSELGDQVNARRSESSSSERDVEEVRS
jgi:hypothetical protein